MISQTIVFRCKGYNKMLRNSKFKKEVGFIRSLSSKGLPNIRNPEPSDSEQFSSFEYGRDRQQQHDSEGQFSPYKQPHLGAPDSRETLGRPNAHSIDKKGAKSQYPPRNTGKSWNNRDPPNLLHHSLKYSAQCDQSGHKIRSPNHQKTKKEQLVSFSNEKLKLQCRKPENSNINYCESFTLQEVNRICDRIHKIKSDFQFDSDYKLMKKPDGAIEEERSGRFQALPTSPYEKMLEKEKRKAKDSNNQRDQDFSLGKDSLNISPIQNKQSSPKQANISMAFNFQDQLPRGCHQPQHRLLKPRLKSNNLDEESSISENSLPQAKEQRGDKKFGKIKQKRRPFLENQQENQELVAEYRTCDFQNKGMREQVLQTYSNQKNYRSRNPGKVQTQEGLKQAKGGICFELDTKEFVAHSPERQTSQNIELVDDSYEYLRTKHKRPPAPQPPKPVKKKKVNMKEQLLKRRQNARNYDQMARNRLFRGY